MKQEKISAKVLFALDRWQHQTVERFTSYVESPSSGRNEHLLRSYLCYVVQRLRFFLLFTVFGQNSFSSKKQFTMIGFFLWSLVNFTSADDLLHILIRCFRTQTSCFAWRKNILETLVALLKDCDMLITNFRSKTSLWHRCRKWSLMPREV